MLRQVAVQVVAVGLVEIDDQRVLPGGVEALGFVEQPLERDAIAAQPADQLDRAPAVLALLRVGVRDPLQGL
jgi:hypothetical protein